MQAALLLVLTLFVGVLIPVHRFVEVRCEATRTGASITRDAIGAVGDAHHDRAVGVSQVSLAAKQLSVWTSRDAEMAFHLSTYGAVALGAPLPLRRNVPLRSGA